MQDGLLDIILLAMIAGFILLRLRSVLGKRTGFERPPTKPPAAGAPDRDDGDDRVVQLPDRRRDEDRASAWGGHPGVGRIKAADPSFDDREFMSGARGAYEMIVTAFAQGDVATLRNLLAPEVLAGFSQAIDERKQAGETHETIVNTIKTVEIVEADMRGSVAEVTVRFVSELVNTIRDRSGAVVPGSGRPEDVTDVWTFSRDTRSSDPNWLLVATQAPA